MSNSYALLSGGGGPYITRDLERGMLQLKQPSLVIANSLDGLRNYITLLEELVAAWAQVEEKNRE